MSALLTRQFWQGTLAGGLAVLIFPSWLLVLLAVSFLYLAYRLDLL